jgi:hypothetical protein
MKKKEAQQLQQEKGKTGRKKNLTKKKHEIILCRMVGIISIKVKEERAEEAKGQNPQRHETLTDGGLSSNRRRR